jgi:hypothetical protein
MGRLRRRSARHFEREGLHPGNTRIQDVADGLASCVLDRLLSRYSEAPVRTASWGWGKYGKAAITTLGEAITKNNDIQAEKILLTQVSAHLPKEAVAAIFRVDVSDTSVEVFQRAYDMALGMTTGQTPKMIEYQDLEPED